jgi:hypothetical protein
LKKLSRLNGKSVASVNFKNKSQYGIAERGHARGHRTTPGTCGGIP